MSSRFLILNYFLSIEIILKHIYYNIYFNVIFIFIFIIKLYNQNV